MITTIYVFQTLAYSGKEFYHPVEIQQYEYIPKYDTKYHGLVLKIVGTPGGWYLHTLLEESHTCEKYPTMSIQGNWHCLNWQEIVTELKQWVADNIK